MRLFLHSLILLASCRGIAQAEEPPSLRLGVDICDYCSMMIDDIRFASAYVTTEGKVRRFDDIGGLLITLKERGESIQSVWVHDISSLSWIDGEKAIYVHGGTMTPMGYALSAFSLHEEAERFAQESGGIVMSWEEILTSEITPQSPHQTGGKE
ncbi:nitrous oxide reductase accessory protein NosL [bacterium]|nr:nitrous oxide reductase accessory protein NosL [bacterium]